MGTLATELLRFDKDAEATYARIIANQDGILAHAREEAMGLVQDAERRRGKDREDALKAHDLVMHRRKEEIIANATATARRVRASAETRYAVAADAILAAALREATK